MAHFNGVSQTTGKHYPQAMCLFDGVWAAEVADKGRVGPKCVVALLIE